VARHARHDVVVVLKTYAHCIDGQVGTANQPIADTLSALTGQGPATARKMCAIPQPGFANRRQAKLEVGFRAHEWHLGWASR
jgi:hypothetical protein